MNAAVKKKMLITGVSGLLGGNLAFYFKDKFDVLGLYCSHPVSIPGIRTQKASILSEVFLQNIIDGFAPDVVIHCAALADIEACELNKRLAERVNILGAGIVADSVKDAKLIYISTDSVYDGGKGDFKETDSVNPPNHYGLTKYKGEVEALKKNGTLVLRTNIFGWNIRENKYSLAEWILKELEAGNAINGFKDVFFSTIYTMELARVIDVALQKNLTGVYNCGSIDSCSKYEFCLKVADVFGFDKRLISAVSVDDYPFKAKRGRNLSLDCGKLKDKLGSDHDPTIKLCIGAFYRNREEKVLAWNL